MRHYSLTASLLAHLFVFPALAGPTTPNDLFRDIAIHAPKRLEPPMCRLNPLSPPEGTEDEILLSFEEWKAKQLADIQSVASTQTVVGVAGHKPRESAPLDVHPADTVLPAVSSGTSPGAAPAPGLPLEYTDNLPPDPPYFRIPLTDRFNYASMDCSARVHTSHKSAKSASSILSSKKDRYMLSPCAEPSPFVVVELCDDIRIDTVQLANFEFFSGVFKDFSVSVSKTYTEGWTFAGTYRARNSRGVQSFHPPTTLPDFYRFIRIDFHSHYGNEYWCPLSLFRVYGLTHLEHWKWDTWEAESRQRQLMEEAAPVVVDEIDRVQEEVSSIKDADTIQKGTVGGTSYGTGDSGRDNGSEPDRSTAKTEAVTVVPVDHSASHHAGTGSTASVPPLPLDPDDIPRPTQGVGNAIPSSSSITAHIVGPPSLDQTSQPNAQKTAYSNDYSNDPARSHSNSSPSAPLYNSDINTSNSEVSSSASISVSLSSSSSLSSALSSPSSLSYSSASSPSVSIISTTPSSHTARSGPSTQSHTLAAVPHHVPASTAGESIYRIIMNRLTALETNTTLYARFVEEHTASVRDMLRRLGEDVGRLDGIGKAQAQMYQRSVNEFERYRRRLELEHLELLSKVNRLTDEVILEKRLGIAQLCLLLTVLIFMALTRGSRGEVAQGPHGSVRSRASSLRGWSRRLSLSGEWVNRFRGSSRSPAPSDMAKERPKVQVAFPSVEAHVNESFPKSRRQHPITGGRRAGGVSNSPRPRTPIHSPFARHSSPKPRPATPSRSITALNLRLPTRPSMQRTLSGGIAQSFSMGTIGPVPKSAKRWARTAHLHEVKSATGIRNEGLTQRRKMDELFLPSQLARGEGEGGSFTQEHLHIDTGAADVFGAVPTQPSTPQKESSFLSVWDTDRTSDEEGGGGDWVDTDGDGFDD